MTRPVRFGVTLPQIKRTWEEARGDFLDGQMDRKSISCLFATQYEAVDFIDDGRVYVASEKTVFIPPRVKVRRVRKKGAEVKVVMRRRSPSQVRAWPGQWARNATPCTR